MLEYSGLSEECPQDAAPLPAERSTMRRSHRLIAMGGVVAAVVAISVSLLAAVQTDRPKPARDAKAMPELLNYTPPAAKDETVYCVLEGHPTTLEGCDFVVERIEDVPKGVTLVPSHGGLDDPEEIRRFWCTDYAPEDMPTADERPECAKYYK